jgi:sterol desaturase/sphingolipid hydroxylase (fatty acid hydroxylase superfamily)
VEYINAFWTGTRGYAEYLWREITHPHWQNYFYWLTGISLIFFALELIRPWRRDQPKFRKDFWLDAFYMYFNYFLFSLLIFAGLKKVGEILFNDFLGLFNLENILALKVDSLPLWAHILILFVSADFLQWWTHRLLHRWPWLWEFHKVHHSIEQMGFAGHLRYHWMENVVYRLTTYIPLSMLGFDLADLFAVYMFNTVVGHYNHANITVDKRISGGIFGALIGLAISSGSFGIHLLPEPSWSLGILITLAAVAVGAFLLGPVMKYIFNSPEMHIWHHAHDMPQSHVYGINFGLTLAIWDWIFGTAWWPSSGRDIKLGFPGIAKFPKHFFGQFIHGFGKKS